MDTYACTWSLYPTGSASDLFILQQIQTRPCCCYQVFDVALVADVAAPLLDFSERTLTFHHEYQKGRPIEAINKTLTLK